MCECLARFNGENDWEAFFVNVVEKRNFFVLMRICLDCERDVNYLLTGYHVFSGNMRGWRNW